MAIATINPATGEVVKKFEPLTDAEVEAKVKRAAETFPEYRKVPFAERARRMMKAAEILEAEKEDCGRMMTLEMGKTLKAPRWRRRPSARGHADTTPRTPSASWPMKSWKRRREKASCAISRWGRCWR